MYCAGRDDGAMGGEHRAFAGEETWSDYTITTRATLYWPYPDRPASIGFGFYFRATHDSNGRLNAYVFQYDPGLGGAFVFRKVANDEEAGPIARSNAPRDYVWYGVEREIRVTVVGAVFTAFVDGEQVLQASDTSYPNGNIGMRTWNQAKACFNEIAVALE